MTVFLSSCAGGTVGRPGSAMWKLSTTDTQKMSIIENRCLGYGFSKGNPNWAECVQKEHERLGLR